MHKGFLGLSLIIQFIFECTDNSRHIDLLALISNLCDSFSSAINALFFEMTKHRLLLHILCYNLVLVGDL